MTSNDQLIKKIKILLLLMACPFFLVAQNTENENTEKHRVDKKLEVELELYPFNALDFSSQSIS